MSNKRHVRPGTNGRGVALECDFIVPRFQDWNITFRFYLTEQLALYLRKYEDATVNYDGTKIDPKALEALRKNPMAKVQ